MSGTLEANKNLVRRQLQELWNEKKGPKHAGEFWAEDVEIHNKAMPNAPTGLAGVNAHMAVLFKVFPDWHFEIHDLIAEGDKVVAHITMSGTYQTTSMHLNNLPAAGQPVKREQICRGAPVFFQPGSQRIVLPRLERFELAISGFAEAATEEQDRLRVGTHLILVCSSPPGPVATLVRCLPGAVARPRR